MRRGVIGSAVVAPAVLAVLALSAAACGKPAGVDGNLTNGWAALPEAKLPVPVTGACYNVDTDDPASVTRWPEPVDCTTTHTVETVYVGTFEGADAERGSSPGAGSTGRRTAYEKCTVEARTYLGDDWRTGRLGLSLVLPIAQHWQLGARWFRCTVLEYEDLEDYDVVPRTESLKGALGGESEVALSCMAITTTQDNRVDKILPVRCDSGHNGEFAGIFDLPDGPYPGVSDAARKARLDGCGAVVAKFTAVPNDGELLNRIGWVSSPFGEVDWALGNRGTRCYAYTDAPVTSSLKGAGPSKLPVD